PSDERADAALTIEDDQRTLTCTEGGAFPCQTVADDLLGTTLQIPVERRLDDQLGMVVAADHRRQLIENIVDDVARIVGGRLAGIFAIAENERLRHGPGF